MQLISHSLNSKILPFRPDFHFDLTQGLPDIDENRGLVTPEDFAKQAVIDSIISDINTANFEPVVRLFQNFKKPRYAENAASKLANAAVFSGHKLMIELIVRHTGKGELAVDLLDAALEKVFAAPTEASLAILKSVSAAIDQSILDRTFGGKILDLKFYEDSLNDVDFRNLKFEPEEDIELVEECQAIVRVILNDIFLLAALGAKPSTLLDIAEHGQPSELISISDYCTAQAKLGFPDGLHAIMLGATLIEQWAVAPVSYDYSNKNDHSFPPRQLPLQLTTNTP